MNPNQTPGFVIPEGGSGVLGARDTRRILH
jgi:hypothetical protein